MTLDPQRPKVDQLIQNFKSGLEARDKLIALANEWLREQVNGQIYELLRYRIGESDVAQEAVIKVIEGLETFKGNTEAQFRAWVNSIGQHKLHDLIRREKGDGRNPEKELRLNASPDAGDSSGQQPLSPDSTPSKRAMRNEDEKRIQEAMDKLSRDHRKVIDLRQWDELEYEEIGRRMGRSADAAKHLYQRALEELRRHLGEGDR